MRPPGYPAFLMSTRKQQKEALIRFLFVVLFSIIPLLLIGFLNSVAKDSLDFFSALGKYTQAGQIYFYVGAITGSAFLLIRDNFRGHSVQGKRKLTGGEEIMQVERSWFTLYMLLVAIISTVILSVYHLGVEKNGRIIYWSSAIIYLVSLYVWFVDILYSQIDLSERHGEGAEDDGHSMNNRASVALINDALDEMGAESEK